MVILLPSVTVGQTILICRRGVPLFEEDASEILRETTWKKQGKFNGRRMDSAPNVVVDLCVVWVLRNINRGLSPNGRRFSCLLHLGCLYERGV